jgi:hypothetical protein
MIIENLSSQSFSVKRRTFLAASAAFLVSSFSSLFVTNNTVVLQLTYKNKMGGSFNQDELLATITSWLDLTSYNKILETYQKQGKISKILKSSTSDEYKTEIYFTSKQNLRDFYTSVSPLVKFQSHKMQNYYYDIKIKV